MASIKERERWERWYDAVDDRLNRQRETITRLVLLLTESVAALEEIAAMDGSVPDGQTTPLEWAQERARLALDRIKEPAAATQDSAEELVVEELPDPRRNRA